MSRAPATAQPCLSSYDNLGRTAQLQKVIGGTTYTTHYAYNLAGELTSITYPSGLAYVYTQNGGNNGQITSITDNVNSTRT